MFTALLSAAGRTRKAHAAHVRTAPAAESLVEPLEGRRLMSADVVHDWNELLLQSLPSQPPRVPLSRNMALVHVAIFDAVNAIDRSYEPYAADVHASRGASKEAAAAQAAHDTLSALYPGRRPVFAAELAADLAGIDADRAAQGVAVGAEVARQILASRADDGAAAIKTYTPPNQDPGQWQPTPPDFLPAGAVHTSDVTPYAVRSSEQFRPGPPPALTSPEYAAAFNEAKALGRATDSTRTADQSLVANLWRTALGNHQVWNRVAQEVSAAQGQSLPGAARTFALMNVSLHDGLATSFGTKYHYGLWRPVTAIQRAGEDDNPATEADPAWATFHPTTPPYPTYSGNAATIGAACATVLAGVFGDGFDFQFDWGRQGFAGVNRSYDSFWDAAEEQADSRIYGGIHFRFDSEAGQHIGRGVGGYVLDNYLSPRKNPSSFSSDRAAAGGGAVVTGVYHSALFAFGAAAADDKDADGSGATGLLD